ncbi:MAG: ATP-dependent DNA helicase [Actinomycetota bacterium]
MPGLAGRTGGIPVITPSLQQQAILAAGLRPLRITAGAGTGKTTTIALYVAHLVKEGLEPEQVLGITFTNKAAAELSDRVREMLAPITGPGREAEVHTYHGFAAQVIREYGALVGVERQAPVITPTFSRQMLFEVMRRRRFQHVNATWAGTVDRILRLGASLGDHLVDPSRLAASATDDPPWPERLELLAAWEDYQDEKRRLGLVDYNDLISRTAQLLSHSPEVAGRVRGRYQVVLLDEYQDTNPAQRVMLQRVFGRGFAVVAVGDVDQTIYEWRGAAPDNFEAFPQHFPQADGFPSPSFHLTVNRRSGPEVLAVANAIREQTGNSGNALEALPDAPRAYVAVRWASDAVAEADWIADRIVRLHQEGTPWKEMAVLFRKNRHISLIHDALAEREIPVEVANLGGLLTVPEVADVRAWMRLLHSPEDGPALLRILMGPRHRLGMGDLAPLAAWVRARSGDSEEVDLDHEGLPSHTMLEAIDHLEELCGLPPRARQALERFTERYRRLLEVAHSSTLAELARSILDVTGTWRDVEAMGSAGRLSARLNLYRFLDLTEEWSPLEGRPSLPAFLAHLELMDENPAEELDAARLSGEDAVALLTVHRAKGMEWDVVFVPAVTRGNFPATPSVIENPYDKPQFLPHEFRLDHPPPVDASTPLEDARSILRQMHMRQEWRAAYVAATRARRRLYVSGSHWYGVPTPTQKPAEPSDLYRLVAGQPGVDNLGEDICPPRPEILRAPDRAPAPDPLFRSGWATALRQAVDDPEDVLRQAEELGVRDAVQSRMEEFQQRLIDLEDVPLAEAPPPIPATSVTGLVTYAACPRRHYWSEVDRLPRRPSPAARRGVEVHRRIELHALGQIPLGELDPDGYDLVDGRADRGPGSDPYRAYLGSEYARRKASRVEAGFQLPTRAGVSIRGRIDAVYAEGDDWEVVDFKSGLPREDPWLTVQLQAYALAAQRVDFGLIAPRRLRLSFVYLGDGVEVVRHEADPPWMEEAEARVEELSEGIAAGEFQPVPSEACRSCEFTRFCRPGREWLQRDRS